MSGAFEMALTKASTRRTSLGEKPGGAPSATARHDLRVAGASTHRRGTPTDMGDSDLLFFALVFTLWMAVVSTAMEW